jgi:D-arabinose 1-dehydrogenase-like Zn-dependent alcohol dehydrogenase
MPSFAVYKGSQSGSIVKSSTTKDLAPDSVLVRITHSGLCGTDIHYRHADQVLGHEGAGVVESVGSAVTLHKPGDRVGWGYNHDCCGHCKQCLRGMDTYCPERKMYGIADLDQGSMAEKAVWKEGFLFQIPDGVESRDAAPLMCGGATVFNALSTYGVKSTDRVGVLGVGGLGHLAIQFAARMGCDVVVFSGTESKKEESKKLGAKEFWAMKDRKEGFKDGECAPVDHLLVCTSEPPDWSIYLPIMAPGGKIYPLTVSQGDLSFPAMGLILSGLTVQGSLVADRKTHGEMLEFAARNNVRPVVQEFEMSEKGIEKAFETLDSGKMKYRGVLVA